MMSRESEELLPDRCSISAAEEPLAVRDRERAFIAFDSEEGDRIKSVRECVREEEEEPPLSVRDRAGATACAKRTWPPPPTAARSLARGGQLGGRSPADDEAEF